MFIFRHEIVENDLLGSLQTATHHVAPYYANVKPLPNEDSVTGDDTDCGVGAAGIGPSTSHFDEEWREQGAVEDPTDGREPGIASGANFGMSAVFCKVRFGFWNI